MKLSTKSRYGLAVVILLNKKKGQIMSLSSISLSLDLSKIYLEQILAVLKSHQIVMSIKGSSGGYYIKSESQLTVYDVLTVLEPNLTVQEISISQKTLGILLEDKVIQPLGQSIKVCLSSINIDELSNSLLDEEMYYI